MAILTKSDEVYVVGNHGKGFTQSSIGLSVESNGGTVTKKLTRTATHVLIPASDWSPPSTRATAIADHAKDHPLWVLPLAWLADSVAEGQRKKESDYDLQAATASASQPPAPAAKNGNGKGKGKRAKSESDEDSPPPAAPKIVKATMKGSAPPVDSRFPDAASTHVVAGPDGVYWDAMLNQTEIGANKNKFYVIQVLKTDSGNTFHCFNVWGRVGENGQQKVFGPYGAVSQAIADFEKKFKDKTKLTWSNRLEMPVAKMYTYLERSFEEDEEDEEVKAASPKKARTDDAPALVSKLEPQVQSLIRMIFNVSTINQTLSSFEYDASKLPLGKLSKATMDQGYSALKEIAALLTRGQGTRDDFRDLTNRYYTFVPHVFGRNVPPMIDNLDRLKHELALIEALSQLKITTELMAVPKGPAADLHPLDAQFHNLGLKQLDPIPFTSKEFSVLKDLLRNTKGATHNAWELEIMNAFKVCREKDDDQFIKGGFHNLKGGQRRLLWHGSRSSNYGGILSQGLRIAPPEAPVSGYMFGKGLYLASMASKSAGYCFHTISNNEGLLMLIEAQLGPNPMYVREQAEYEAETSCKKAKMLATWGVGRTQPAAWEDAGKLSPELKGVFMPSTVVPPIEANKTSSLLYDEFITYSTAQVRIRYLLRVKFVDGYRGY